MGRGHDSMKKVRYVEMSDQLAQNYLCGSCVMGFTDLEAYRAHCDEEQHKYHITRRIELLVPGLGFCPACSCLIQTSKGWENHLKTSTKHTKCIESLNCIGIDGNFDKPLGCDVPGELGAPICHTKISPAVANYHGANNGGLVIHNAPLIGLNEVKLVNKDDKADQPNYHCGICDIKFTYESRAKHMLGIEHRTKYFEGRYPDYHVEISDLNNTKTNQPNLLNCRTMFLAHKVEELEKEKETEFAEKLRVKWKTEATKKSSGITGITPSARGSQGLYRGGRGGFPGNYGPPAPPPPPPPAGGYFPGPRYRTYGDIHPCSTLPRGRGSPPRHFQEYATLGKRGSGDYPPHSYKRHKHDPYAEAGDINQLQDDDWYASMNPYEAVEDNVQYGRAMEAVQVLEDYTAKHSDIKSRIDGVNRAMMGCGRGSPRMVSKLDVSSLTDPYRPSPWRGGPGPSSSYRGGPGSGRGGPGRFRGGPGPSMGPPFRVLEEEDMALYSNKKSTNII